MKQKAFIILLAAVVALGGVISGAFVGGMTLGKSQGKEEAKRELLSQFSQFRQGGSQQGTPQSGSPWPGGLMGRGGTTGTVEKVEGKTITLSTPGGALRVLVTDSTSIQKTGEGSLSDISPGENISVMGERKEDGSIEASNIFITPSSMAR